VLGGQLAVQLGTMIGSTNANINGILTASLPPFGLVRNESISNTVTGFGDLYPLASLKWNAGVHNFMTYVTGDIPVGNYSSTSIANLGVVPPRRRIAQGLNRHGRTIRTRSTGRCACCG
jgi:hypothetical protein